MFCAHGRDFLTEEHMAKRKLTSFVIIIAALALLVFSPVGALAAFDGDDVTPTEAVYYGRGALASMENGEAYLYAYDNIVKCVENTEQSASVYNGEYRLTTEELIMVYDAYRRDHTEHFWLGNEYSYNTEKIFPSYIMTGDKLSAARAEFDARVAEIISGISIGTSEFDIELYLHDLLAGMTEYVRGANAHNAYGAIVEGKAVCEGYAEALGYLLQRMGICAFMITGESVNASTGLPEGHEWCAVKIDGSFYHVDPTWNDQGETIYYAYFNLSDEQIKEDHTIDETQYPLPVCNSMAKNYFNVKGGAFSDGEYTVDNIAALLKSGSLTARVYIDGSAEAFRTWYGDNIMEIAKKCDVEGGFRYGTKYLGNECIISIVPEHVHTPTLVAAKDATCTERGNIAHYICSCGKIFDGQDAQNELTEADVFYDAIGHNYKVRTQDDEHLRSKGSCQEKWSYWLSCTRCEKSAKDDSLAQDKYFLIDKYGEHNVSKNLSTENEKHFYPCTVEGCTYREGEESCSGGEASCVSLAKCGKCGKEYGALTEHTFDMTSFAYKGTDGHAHKCTNVYCNVTDTLLPHTPGDEPTESTAQLCLDCGYIIKPAISHTEHTPRDEWEFNDSVHWKSCSGCEDMKFSEGEHRFEGCEEKCKDCDFKRINPHVLGEWQRNDTEHFRTCPCGEVEERGKHIDADDNKACDVCNKILVKSAYADIEYLQGIKNFLEKMGVLKLLNPIKERLDGALLGAGFPPTSAATLSVTIIIACAAVILIILLMIAWFALKIHFKRRRRRKNKD